MKTMRTMLRRSAFAAVTSGLLLAGCGKSKPGDLLKADNPKQAASNLEQTFQNAEGTMKQTISSASEAMRNHEYEKAIVSLHTVQQAKGITMEQGLAIHSSMVSLEQDLINAMERGDQNAKKAYDLLRRMKRN